MTLYKLASGGTPFDDHKNHAERHAALVRGQWKDLEEVYPGLPEGFYEVVKRSLGVKPEERYQTAREMREALERAAFDAHIRIGQSSLMGYLDDDGEVTAEGGSRSVGLPRHHRRPQHHRARARHLDAARAAAAGASRCARCPRRSRAPLATERLPPMPREEEGRESKPRSARRGLRRWRWCWAWARRWPCWGRVSEPLVVNPPPPDVEPTGAARGSSHPASRRC